MIRYFSLIILIWLLVGCLQIFDVGSQDIDLPEPESTYNQTSNPIGGGNGYTDIITRKDADHIVYTLKDLREAIKAAKKGDIIFLPEEVTINFTNQDPLIISESITLASNRGDNGKSGALLAMVDFSNKIMIRVEADSVRLTGLRIEGPDKKQGKTRDGLPRVIGVNIKNYNGLEVDNSEIFGWSFSGIKIRDSKGAYIHHNHIHRNRRIGLGYGISLNSYDPEQHSTALIEANYFNLNRHSIAGSGQKGVSYEARYNYIRKNTISHSFDMHGDYESPGSGSYYAGDDIKIHHNTFYPKNEGVVIRGIPRKGAHIYKNNFLRAEQSVAIRQRNYFGNIEVRQNVFSGTEKAWYVSWGGNENWYALKTDPLSVSIRNTYLGDFNGDKKSDLLVCQNGVGYISFSGDSHYGHGRLRKLNIDLSNKDGKCVDLLIGDFKTETNIDIAKVENTGIYITDLDKPDWNKTIVYPNGEKVEAVSSGDFNGDGKDDLFAFDGTNWFVSYNASGSWTKIKQRNAAPNQILIGKFTNKKTDDILMVEDGSFVLHSFSPSIEAALPAFNNEKKGPYFAGDFDGDGITDLLNLGNNQVSVNFTGDNSWSVINSFDSLSVDEVKVGDFNGDGTSDIIINQKGLW